LTNSAPGADRDGTKRKLRRKEAREDPPRILDGGSGSVDHRLHSGLLLFVSLRGTTWRSSLLISGGIASRPAVARG